MLVRKKNIYKMSKIFAYITVYEFNEICHNN